MWDVVTQRDNACTPNHDNRIRDKLPGQGLGMVAAAELVGGGQVGCDSVVMAL